jgi:PKD repeat protein
MDDIEHPSEQLSWLAVDPGPLSGEPLDLPPVAEDVGPIQTVAGAHPFLIGPRGSDPEGEDITFHSYTEPTLAGPLIPVLGLAVEYIPPHEVPGGVQAVDTFTYRIRDPGGFHSHWATVTVVVDPPPVTNQPPTPAGDQVTVYEGECATIESTDLLLNDTDPEGDALLFDGVIVNPSHGQLTVTSLSPLRATYRYCPFGGYVGTDSFVYQVEDEGGLTAEATVSITVLDDLPPQAVLPLPLCSGMSCAFDGSASTDDLGIDLYTWSFGDGTGADGPTPIHDFPGSGTYLITLTVTDTAGQTDSVAVEVVFDTPPVAAFDATCTGLACLFDAGASSDDLGIAGYAWSFGDGTPGSGQTPSHQYAAAGSYQVTLTVTDTAGQPGSVSLELTLDLPPTAALSISCDDLACRFDAGGSSDDTGIAGYAWDFGDGTTGSGEVVDHEFAEEREYTVTLTVTDEGGQTDAASAVAAPRDELTLMLVILR